MKAWKTRVRWGKWHHTPIYALSAGCAKSMVYDDDYGIRFTDIRVRRWPEMDTKLGDCPYCGGAITEYTPGSGARCGTCIGFISEWDLMVFSSGNGSED